MKRRLSPAIPVSSFRHLILAHLQRCGGPIPIDRDSAVKAGRLAVDAIANGQVNHVAAITRTEAGFQPKLFPLDEIIKLDDAGKVIPRNIDLRFYDAENHQISRAGSGYFRPIFGDMPRPYYVPLTELDIQHI